MRLFIESYSHKKRLFTSKNTGMNKWKMSFAKTELGFVQYYIMNKQNKLMGQSNLMIES